MNRGIVRAVLGKLLILLGLTMVPSFFIALFYNEKESTSAFLITIALVVIVGLIMTFRPAMTKKIRIQDGLVIVTFGWIIASVFGALPFYFSGNIPSYTDAFFETMSGFTTTGASLLTNVEALDNSMLFWRSFTHWIGGMGILVVTVAIFPAMGSGGFQIFRAESPGPTSERIVPRIKDTAKILYITYTVISIAEFILLLLGGMTPLDSAIHTFGTVGTGGFSSKSLSVGYYNSTYIKVVITIFMVLCGVNFSIYYNIIKKKFKNIFDNSELKLYMGIIIVASIFIFIDLAYITDHSLGNNIVDSVFQVVSIITTTGFSTVDFDLWPTFTKVILFFLMFIGGTAGSTAGSIKVIRILILIKQIKVELQKIFHPRAVISLKVDDKSITPGILGSITSFFVLYILVFVLGTLLISLEGYDLITTSSSVAATLGNVGPGFGLVGAANNYSFFSVPSKWLFSILMLLGRLELFTVVALFTPSIWKSDQ
ncbi:TrkH family potassium uptake protein [Alkalibaculum sp. M08DMB]|uniref:TrkH family potassium uptake protein n=1 Tax=Alkalibaculum sporogenes TaxID=2655001 RepID=A0A6A7K532_9FIRM|nr:TrkH family potassium uptake protein [Alkalibaculum sporogenes]MPW24481.1 TrkH family potassium uptake protein [Alkalibaculum sporogenes]